MKKLILLSTFCLAIMISNNSWAQLFVKGSVGYGAGTQKLLLEKAIFQNSTENIYGSFGGNLGINLGVGSELNDYIDWGIDLSYQHGRSIAADSYFYKKTYVGRLIFLNPSITFKTLIDNNFTPYARLGIFTGLPLTKVIVGGSEKKFRGGLPFGANGALGVDYNISTNFKLFGEITHQTMIYKPTRRREMDGTVIRFKDELPYPEPTNEEISHHFFSFGALNVNLGFKIILK